MSAHLIGLLRKSPGLGQDPAFGLSLLVALSREKDPKPLLQEAVELGFSVAGDVHYQPPLWRTVESVPMGLELRGNAEKKHEGWIRLAEALLDAGADPLEPNRENQIPFDHFFWRKKSECPEGLVSRMVECIQPSSMRAVLMHRALGAGCAWVPRILLEQGCQPDPEGPGSVESILNALFDSLDGQRPLRQVTVDEAKSLLVLMAQHGFETSTASVHPCPEYGTPGVERQLLLVFFEEQRLGQTIPAALAGNSEGSGKKRL
jgi:hypothetical protein